MKVRAEMNIIDKGSLVAAGDVYLEEKIVIHQVKLIATKNSADTINRIVGGASLEYLDVEDLSEMADHLPLCTACFTGEYPAGKK